MSPALFAACIAGLLLAGAVLAVVESSLLYLGRARAASLAERGRKRADRLAAVLEHRERTLQPVLLLQVAVHVSLATLVTWWVGDHWGGAGIAVAWALQVLVVFLVAEAVPRTWALQDTDRAALASASVALGIARFLPLRLLTTALIGLARVAIPGRTRRAGPTVSEEELLALAGAAAEADVIDVGERALIESVIEFGDTVAREIMVPRPDMVTVGADFRVVDVIEVVLLNGFSRLPVVGEEVDDIVGIAYAKDLIRADRDGRGEEPVARHVRPAMFVPESKKAAELLREMQTQKVHMAIAVDEYGSTAGLITLEDLIEELVGDIVDEFDVEEEWIEALPGGELRVNGRTPIDEINDLLDRPLPESEGDSVGGLLFSLLGHVPAVGDHVTVAGHRLTAERVDGRRIERVIVEPCLGAQPAEHVDAVAADPAGADGAAVTG